jgi:enamine deaminase RidA (YjgF/YER057c/UK114 family)
LGACGWNNCANDVKVELGSHLLIDLAQEGRPLLMGMARGGVGKHLAGKVVQGGKERHRSMPIVVVSPGANVSLAQRQAGLGAFEGLGLALFITAEHQSSRKCRNGRLRSRPNARPRFQLLQLTGRHYDPFEVHGYRGGPAPELQRRPPSNRMRKRISSGSPYEPKVGISRAVRVGPIIGVAGTAPLGPDGRTVGRGDAAAQARRCLEIIAAALEGAGTSMGQVVRTRILLTRIEGGKLSRQCTVNSFARFARSIRSCRSLALLSPSGWSRSRLMQSSTQAATRSNLTMRYREPGQACPIVGGVPELESLAA